jgi:Tol biopolymer transport system component
LLYSGYTECVDYSPDGTKLAFCDSQAHKTFVINSDGTGLQEIHSGDTAGNGGWSPRWSPDGSKIAFGTTSGIFVVNPDGTDVIQIVSEEDKGFCLSPEWFPEGNRIAYATSDGIYSVNLLDGSIKEHILNYRYFHLSPNGDKALIVASNGLYILDLNSPLYSPPSGQAGMQAWQWALIGIGAILVIVIPIIFMVRKRRV